MKLALSTITSGKSIYYDSRGTSASVNTSLSSAEYVVIDNPPASLANQLLDSKELVVIGGSCDNFGEIVGDPGVRRVTFTFSVAFSAVPDPDSEFTFYNNVDRVVWSSVQSGVRMSMVVSEFSTVTEIAFDGIPGWTAASLMAGDDPYITFTSGNLNGETRSITAVDWYGTAMSYASTKITLSSALSWVPSGSGSTLTSFRILGYLDANIYSSFFWTPPLVWNAGTTSSILDVGNFPFMSSLLPIGKQIVIISSVGSESRTITAISFSGSLSVPLIAPLPTAPTGSGVEFVVLSNSEISVSRRDISLPEPTELVFSTSISSGFESCRARVPVVESSVSTVAKSVVGRMLEVIDDNGVSVWEGRVMSVVARRGEVEIFATGFADTLNYSHYHRYWPPFTLSVDGVTKVYTTPVDVIKDIIYSSRYLSRDLYDVDGTGDIMADQASHQPWEFDFTDSDSTLKDAMDQMLSYGDGTNDFNPLYLQVWEGRRATLFPGVTQESLVTTLPKWTIDSSVDYEVLGDASYEIDMSSMVNRVSVVYSDLATGAQNRTAFYYDIESILDNGQIDAVRSEGSIDSGNAFGLAEITARTSGVKTRIGQVQLGDKISGYVSRNQEDSYNVRSGDIIAISAVQDIWGAVDSTVQLQTKYMIARTEYDAMSRTLTIEPNVIQNRIDVFMAGVL